MYCHAWLFYVGAGDATQVLMLARHHLHGPSEHVQYCKGMI